MNAPPFIERLAIALLDTNKTCLKSVRPLDWRGAELLFRVEGETPLLGRRKDCTMHVNLITGSAWLLTVSDAGEEVTIGKMFDLSFANTGAPYVSPVAAAPVRNLLDEEDVLSLHEGIEVVVVD